MEGLVVELLWSLAVVGICSVVIRVCAAIWIKPRCIRSKLSKQGITGPPPSFLCGNIQELQKIQSMAIKAQSSSLSHDQSVSHTNWVPTIFPYLQHWSKQYGRVFLYSTGNKQHLYVSQPELIKELHLFKSLDLGKPSYLAKPLEPVLGIGVLRANGSSWLSQRKVIAPEFFIHKVKHMLGLMEECTLSMISEWESRIASGGGMADITVNQDLRTVSADIISKACFGSSYSQGKQIFAKLGTLQEVLCNSNLLFGLSNLRLLPTKSNREIWRLNKEVRTLILKVIKDRQENCQSVGKPDQKDLLQAILESAATSEGSETLDTDRFIVDNCKNIYFAGYETTSLTASWCLMLLALHPEWQERVRAEIVDVCGDQLHDCLLDLDKLRQLKTLNMVIQETLRLYGPAVIIPRETLAEMKLGDLIVPKGVYIWTLVPALHRDPENWGPDADEFKPERFESGISEACKYPQAFIPFGIGSRLCLGQTFAMLELKIILAMVLSKFSFSLSPDYRHCPMYKMTLMPKYGIRLLMRGVQKSDVGAKP